MFQLIQEGRYSARRSLKHGQHESASTLCPRVVVVLALISESLRPDLALTELQHCQAQLSAQRPELLTAAISHRELVILDTFDLGGSRATRSALAHKRLVALDSVLRHTLATPAVIAMGVALSGIEGMALSYQSALRTFRAGRWRSPEKTLFSYYDLSLPVLLAGLGSGWQAEQLRQPLQRLDALDKRGRTLRRTLADGLPRMSGPWPPPRLCVFIATRWTIACGQSANSPDSIWRTQTIAFCFMSLCNSMNSCFNPHSAGGRSFPVQRHEPAQDFLVLTFSGV